MSNATSSASSSGSAAANGSAAAAAAAESSSSAASTVTPSSAASASSSQSRVLNINIGILGHVDSGKTSLAKALSTHLSTASLDKLPQSQARGITLDLGFSAFFLPVPERMKGDYDSFQITLVDCPGHASLIRTILGGASIIDLMLLVVDATKGIQTQTAECIVIGEILTEKMIVVVNKTDMLVPTTAAAADSSSSSSAATATAAAAAFDKAKAKLEKNLRNVFASTKFGRDLPIVYVAANPGSVGELSNRDEAGEGVRTSSANANATTNANAAAAPVSANATATNDKPAQKSYHPDVSSLLNLLSSSLSLPVRTRTHLPFLFAVDHCFSLRGSGTVLTGTVLQGQLRVGDRIELPSLATERKVKSLQRFRKEANSIAQGDRAGIAVTQLDAAQMERGLACAPGAVKSYSAVIVAVEKVRFYKSRVETKSKFHVTIGHSTVMATAHFFGGPAAAAAAANNNEKGTAATTAASASAAPASVSAASSSSSASSAAAPVSPSAAFEIISSPSLPAFDFNRDYPFRDELLPLSATVQPHTQFAVLEFERPVLVPDSSLLIGSKLDADIHSPSCRIAFFGRMMCGLDFSDAAARAQLRVYKMKERSGAIDRVVDAHTLIGRDLFNKGTDLSLFTGMKVQLESGEEGVIDSAFGQGGKFKAVFREGLPLPAGAAATANAAANDAEGVRAKAKNKINLKGKIFLRFKKYIYAQDRKQMVQ